MKGIVIYSSNTGNTKKLANEIFSQIKKTDEWVLEEVKNNPNTADFDVVLLGGWVEGGKLDKSSLNFLSNLDKSNKKIGLFVTMGSRTSTEHGKLCERNLASLLDEVNSLGVKLVQGKVSRDLVEKLSNLPDSVIPESVKIAMKDGFENYSEPTEEEYKAIADFFGNQLK